MDLDAYLRRIGWSGAIAPDLASLQSLAARHTAAIAFENLNPFLGLPVSLDIGAVQSKIVGEGRGGYCFEQNRLFAEALRRIGFEVSELAARVLWNQPEDAITSRSHMLLRVELADASWLVDVGFGGQTPTGALKLIADIEQATPHEPYRLVSGDGEWRAQTRLGDTWKTLYRFDLQPQYAIDYEAPNYFLSTHPSSHFTRNLVAARAAPGRRFALFNNELAVHSVDGVTERRRLRSAEEIVEVLKRDFLLTLPATPRLHERLAEVAALSSPSGRG